MARDYYREAADIADLLEAKGLAEDSSALRLAMESGATATEILMALRWQLRVFGARAEHAAARAQATRCEWNYDETLPSTSPTSASHLRTRSSSSPIMSAIHRRT